MTTKYDAVVVGAGFSGLYMLHKLRRLGLSAKAFEKGGDVGGTWYWNRYPGARCDIESLEYSYSFDEKLQQDWNWTSRYATQPELLHYLQHCADRFDLRRDIQFNTTVVSAHFYENSHDWEITTDSGAVITARFCIMATGNLVQLNMPQFKGQELFKGKFCHTARWPHEGIDLQGKRVGVIGTGSSGVQCIPIIAKQASQLYVFQRTANFSCPANDAPLTPEYQAEYKSRYSQIREEARSTLFWKLNIEPERKCSLQVSEEERQKMFEKWWAIGGFTILFCYDDLYFNAEANNTIADFYRSKIQQTVKDKEVAKLLTPVDHPVGSKRPVVDSFYYETFNRENVTLVDIKKTPIEELTEGGLIVGGKEYELDVIVFATGFDAITGALNAIDIRGIGGATLKKRWEAGPVNYLALMTSGFPNFFTIIGPSSPAGLSNYPTVVEQTVDMVGDIITYMRSNNYNCVDASPEEEKEWTEHVAETASRTVLPLADSWYVGSNIPGKPRVVLIYTGGMANYDAKCKDIAKHGYTGFVFR